MNFTHKTMAQGALILTLSAGGLFYTTADSVTPAGNGCIQYTTVDGATKKLCGQSASLILNKAETEQLAKHKKIRIDSDPTSTASLPNKSKSDCLRKKEAGLNIGPFCKISLALETTP